jgi:hypothetical protein
LNRMTTLTRLAMILAVAAGTAGAIAADEPSAKTRWHIRGDLTESCTCSVPCSCNFGQGPSPNHYCWALFAYGIQRGNYGKVKLDGLRLGGAAGEKGFVIYVDQRATPEQAEALKAIAQHIGSTMQPPPGTPPDDPSLKLLGFKTAPIEQVVGDKSCRLALGDAGGFQADYLIGIDGKSPIMIENNWSWNVTHCIKAKASHLQYKDEFGNEFDVRDVNANQGRFDYTEKTKVFLR